MTTFGFSAFLKLANLSAVRQRSTIRERVRGDKKGGYDFHKAMRSICGRYLVDGTTLDECLREAAKIIQEAERKSAIAAITRLGEWRSRLSGDVFPVPSRTYESPRKEFKVRLDVDFGISIGGQRVAVHLWNTKFPALDLRLTRAALALFPGLYAGTDINDFAVLSLKTSQLVRLQDASGTAVISARMVEALEDMFIDLRSGGTSRPGIEDRPRP